MKFLRLSALSKRLSRWYSSAVDEYPAVNRYDGRMTNSMRAGLKPVMKSDCRLRLSRRRLSLYSSDTAIEGNSVNGPRWAAGASSPNSSSGYDPIATPALGRAEGTPVAGAGGSALAPPTGVSWPQACGAIAQMTIQTIAPAPSSLTR